MGNFSKGLHALPDNVREDGCTRTPCSNQHSLEAYWVGAISAFKSLQGMLERAPSCCSVRISKCVSCTCARGGLSLHDD
jgi:hypothetical protein